MEDVRKVVDSELGFVADVPYRRSGAKVSGVIIGVWVMSANRQDEPNHVL